MTCGAILIQYRRGDPERPIGVADYPETVQAAVHLLHELVPNGEQAVIRAMAQSALINLHHGLSQWIRNQRVL